MHSSVACPAKTVISVAYGPLQCTVLLPVCTVFGPRQFSRTPFKLSLLRRTTAIARSCPRPVQFTWTTFEPMQFSDLCYAVPNTYFTSDWKISLTPQECFALETLRSDTNIISNKPDEVSRIFCRCQYTSYWTAQCAVSLVDGRSRPIESLWELKARGPR
jgi:hypothetical protein